MKRNPTLFALATFTAALGLFVGCGSITINGSDGGAGGGGGTSTGGHGGGTSTGGHGGTSTGGSGGTGRDASGYVPGDGCICPAIYMPVCGADGKTYSNSCEAGCAGVTIAYQGACADAGTDAGKARGACNTDQDCVFMPTDSCCGTCLAIGDQPIPGGASCAGIACIVPPGGCSCVNHACQRGILTAGKSCDAQHDACGSGLKCCSLCGIAPVDGGPMCPAPTCVSGTINGGKLTCPLVP